MLLKYGVNPIFDSVLYRVLWLIDDVHQRVVGREAIVTSGNDGRHGPNSLHYKGRAMDLRTKDLEPSQVSRLAMELKKTLGNDWDVVIEHKPPHIHIEYDPK